MCWQKDRSSGNIKHPWERLEMQRVPPPRGQGTCRDRQSSSAALGMPVAWLRHPRISPVPSPHLLHPARQPLPKARRCPKTTPLSHPDGFPTWTGRVRTGCPFLQPGIWVPARLYLQAPLCGQLPAQGPAQHSSTGRPVDVQHREGQGEVPGKAGGLHMLTPLLMSDPGPALGFHSNGAGTTTCIFWRDVSGSRRACSHGSGGLAVSAEAARWRHAQPAPCCKGPAPMEIFPGSRVSTHSALTWGWGQSSSGVRGCVPAQPFPPPPRAHGLLAPLRPYALHAGNNGTAGCTWHWKQHQRSSLMGLQPQ